MRRGASRSIAYHPGLAPLRTDELRRGRPVNEHAGQHTQIALCGGSPVAAQAFTRKGPGPPGDRSMNCQQVRAQLAELLYGDVAPPERTEVEKHLACCAECSREYRALANVRRLLDLPKAPASGLGLPGVYRLLAERQAERTRRWRRAALALGGLAALLAVFALGLRLEARVERGQFVVRWGSPP